MTAYKINAVNAAKHADSQN